MTKDPEIKRLQHLVSLDYETRVLAEDLLVRVAMTPSWVPVIHCSRRQWDAIVTYLQPHERTSMTVNGVAYLTINGRPVAYDYDPNDKPKDHE